MAVTTRRRAAAIKNNGVPEKEPEIEKDTTPRRLIRTKKTQRSTVIDHKDTTISKSTEPTLSENGSDESDNNDSGEDDQESASDDNNSDDDQESASDDDNSDDDQEDSSDDDQNDDDEEDDDDDLDDLLNKAQAALRKQQDGVIKLDDDQKNPTDLQFPKLQPGVSVDDELYIKPNKDGIAKLSSQSVAVVESDDKSTQDTKNTKTLVSLKKIQQEPKPLSRKERQMEREKTAGKGWFDMPLADVTPEMKRDLQILKMRHVLDRKRHYKKMGKGSDPKYFQMGTVIEGATEFFSSRINKKDRKRTFAEEILANEDHNGYYYRKYQESQDRKSSGGKKHFKKRMLKRS